MQLEQGLPHRRMGGNDRGRLARLAGAQRLAGEVGHVEIFGDGRGDLDIVEREAAVEHDAADTAIEQAGVEMRQAEMRGEPPGDGALARGRRSVDRDDHEKSAPRPRIRPTKSGKLVAMKPVSSTVIGLVVARPMTRKLMAMR